MAKKENQSPKLRLDENLLKEIKINDNKKICIR